ncbi:MAG: hypothetical protein HY665_04550 [Chloroflexi bacterium]|nr:hypothetical protein [Chloroflexota bacterium]
MKEQSVRVVLASEHPQARSLLRGLVEEEDGAVVVGQAENAGGALTLVRNLRPDVAIIDCFLPYNVGLDSVPLSRISGLDTAQAISTEIPNMRVVLVNNLDAEALPQLDHGLKSPFLAREQKEADVPFTLQELYKETEPLRPLVFARVNVEPRATPWEKVGSLAEKAILFGGLSILAGLILAITIFLTPVGAFLMVAGVAAMLLGVVSKLVTLFKSSGQRAKNNHKVA